MKKSMNLINSPHQFNSPSSGSSPTPRARPSVFRRSGTAPSPPCRPSSASDSQSRFGAAPSGH